MDGKTGAEAAPPSSTSTQHSTQQAAGALGAMTQASGAQPESGSGEGAPAVPVSLSQQGAAEPPAQQPGAPAVEQQQGGSQLLLALPTNGKAAAMVALPPQGEAHPHATAARACGAVMLSPGQRAGGTAALGPLLRVCPLALPRPCLGCCMPHAACRASLLRAGGVLLAALRWALQ